MEFDTLDVNTESDAQTIEKQQKEIDEATEASSSYALRDRVEGILNLARVTTGLDVFFASHVWNPLELAPSSLEYILHHLHSSRGNWVVVQPGQYSDDALGIHSWAFAVVCAKYPSLLCIRDPGTTRSPFAVQHLCRVLKQAVDDHILLEKQALAQRLSVELGRQAQNETLLDTHAPGKSARNLQSMGNVDLDVNIFANAAEYTRRILQAQCCVIFDLSEFRMTHSSPNNSRSHASSSTANTTSSRGLGKRRRDESVPIPENASASSSTNLDTSQPISSLTAREHFVTSGGQKTHCSYIPSASPVRILGHSGIWLDHLERLSGEKSKPVIAEYLSMTRYTGHNSKTFIESRATPMFGLSTLAPPQAKTLLCSSVAEADSQPAYLIFALFEEEEVPFDETEELFVEQMGAYLIYSSIRSRVIAVDRAQMRFTQRIQHELRTPLHAIIGVNEIAKQSLAHPFDLEEMTDLVDSIGTSAEALNVLVDDMVDFSLMERLSGERKLFQAERPLSDWEAICGVIVSTCLRAYQLNQRINRTEQKLGKMAAPPEMFVALEDLHGFDWKQFKAQMDLEVIRRIVWKLVMNSLQATQRGIIFINIARRSPRENKEEVTSMERLHIDVTDTGKGMEQKFVEERLFQPFGKEDEESGGVGLSLTICQHLVAQLAGRLTAKSMVGRGTKMSISIPLKHIGSESKKLDKRPSNGPLIAFLGFETFSKRLFVDKLLDQFQVKECKDLNIAPIVIMTFDDVHLQVDYAKEIEILSSRDSRAEIIIMPALFLRELEEERSIRLEALQLSLIQDSRIIHRPMNVHEIQILSQVIQDVKIAVEADFVQGEMSGLSVDPFQIKLSSPLSKIIEVPRRESGSSDRPSLDHPFSVLVVEDNPLNARIMTTMLKRANMNYYLAQNGREGVEAFEKHLPILILLDINMPIMNGFEACQAMRRVTSPYNHRIIAITALSTEVEKRKGRECGMDDWFTKPTRMAPLMRDIKRWRREYEGLDPSDASTPSSSGVVQSRSPPV